MSNTPSKALRVSILVIHSKQLLKETHKQTGIEGEATVIEYLKNSGYQIHACNYRYHGGEIDIIAQRGDIISFVEVKTRKTQYLEHLSAVITPTKQRKIIRTAQHYLLRHQHTAVVLRFDVALVEYKNSITTISYFPNAFSASE